MPRFINKLLTVLWLLCAALANADVAPVITWMVEGYSLVAKLPCRSCPYLFEDTSKGEHGPWTQRDDDNILVCFAYPIICVSFHSHHHISTWSISSKFTKAIIATKHHPSVRQFHHLYKWSPNLPSQIIVKTPTRLRAPSPARYLFRRLIPDHRLRPIAAGSLAAA
jgi:hypothetical protein